jgi:hypothetical protein
MAEIQIKPNIGEILPSNSTNNGQKDTSVGQPTLCQSPELTKEVEKLRETNISGMIKLNNKIEDLTKSVTSEIKEIKDKFHVQKDYTILQSEQIGEISAALSKAQGMFKIATKTGEGNNFSFAGMNDLVAATKEGLEANGLSIIQRDSYDFESGYYYLCTQLNHSSGQWFRSALLLEPDDGAFVKGNIKSIQSSSSKWNRYAYRDMLCIGISDEEEVIETKKVEPRTNKNFEARSVAPQDAPAKLDFSVYKKPSNPGNF